MPSPVRPSEWKAEAEKPLHETSIASFNLLGLMALQPQFMSGQHLWFLKHQPSDIHVAINSQDDVHLIDWSSPGEIDGYALQLCLLRS